MNTTPAPQGPAPACAEPRNARGVGRPPLYTPERVEKLLQLVRLGFSLEHAAKACGVASSTVRYWRAAHWEFGMAMHAALEHARERRKEGRFG